MWLTVLLIVEILVDKVPAADTANDIIQTFVRPTAGAILFAATTNTMGLSPVLAASSLMNCFLCMLLSPSGPLWTGAAYQQPAQERS